MNRKSESEFSIFSRTPRNEGVDILKRRRPKNGARNDQSFTLQDGLVRENGGGSPRMTCHADRLLPEEQDQNRSETIKDGSPLGDVSDRQTALPLKVAEVHLHLAT